MRTERKTDPGTPRSHIDDRVPIPNRPLSFSPGLLEMRVLARIGAWTVAEIARDLGFAPAEIMAVLERLERLGAVRWRGVVALDSDELEEEADNDRTTSPDLTFERPTWPCAPPRVE